MSGIGSVASLISERNLADASMAAPCELRAKESIIPEELLQHSAATSRAAQQAERHLTRSRDAAKHSLNLQDSRCSRTTKRPFQGLESRCSRTSGFWVGLQPGTAEPKTG